MPPTITGHAIHCTAHDQRLVATLSADRKQLTDAACASGCYFTPAELAPEAPIAVQQDTGFVFSTRPRRDGE